MLIDRQERCNLPRKHRQNTVSVFLLLILSKLAGSTSRSAYPNAALFKSTSQGPRQYRQLGSEFAVDGDFNTAYPMCTHTDFDPIVWWMVDLGSDNKIHGIALLNRNDVEQRLSNITVDIFRHDPREYLSSFPEGYGKVCTHFDEHIPASEWGVFSCQVPLIGRYVRVVRWHKTDNYLTLCEVEVFATPLSSSRTFSKDPDGQSSASAVLLSENIGVYPSAVSCAVALLSQSEIQEAFSFDESTKTCYAILSNFSTW